MTCKEIAEYKISKIREYYEKSNCNKVVIGISGGKDSLVAAKLCCEAVGKENVYGILMPNGTQADIMDSYETVQILGIEYEEINIENVYYATKSALGKEKPIANKETMINVSPRIRMMLLYGKASEIGALVCGTGNLCERKVGYFTKHGDGACDFNPLGDLLVSEVKQVGLCLGLPDRLVNKKPADGLSGKTDEEKLGVSYNQIEYFLTGNKDKNTEEVNNKIESMIRKTEHKRVDTPIFEISR